MEQSSIKSGFQFLSYKIDKIDFKMEPNANAVLSSIMSKDVKTGFFVRNPAKFTEDGNIYYMCGIESRIEINKENTFIAQGEFGIEGLFRVDKNFDKKLETAMVLSQFPTILFPYLRSSITSILAFSGFGSVVIPLVNVHNLVKKQQERGEIKIIFDEDTV